MNPRLNIVAAAIALASIGDMPRADPQDTTEKILRPMRPPTIKGERNKPCPCGSGKKFKRCCIGR